MTNEQELLRHRHLVQQLRERFNAMRMTAGVLGMEDNPEQAAEWLGFIADAAADCAELVDLIIGAPDEDEAEMQSSADGLVDARPRRARKWWSSWVAGF